MLIDSERIKQTKEQIEVMQAFIDGKEIEFKPDSYRGSWKASTTPTWDFSKYKYRIKPLEPEFVYPIYKRLKDNPETVVKFHSIDTGIYVSVQKDSIYKPGDIASNMAPHTDSVWEDCIVSINEDLNINEPIVELYEVMKETNGRFFIESKLYEFKEIVNYHSAYRRTGRSFVINKDTKEIIKIKNKKRL